MTSTRKLWLGLSLVFVLSFAALGWLGREIYLAAPPIPDIVRAQDGEVLYSGEQIRDGQRAWRAAGGQQLGSVWGHGAYVAPDWSAEWLHREAVAYRDLLSKNIHGEKYDYLTPTQRAGVDARVKETMRANTYDEAHLRAQAERRASSLAPAARRMSAERIKPGNASV